MEMCNSKRIIIIEEKPKLLKFMPIFCFVRIAIFSMQFNFNHILLVAKFLQLFSWMR